MTPAEAGGARGRLVLATVGDERGASGRYRVLAHRPALEAAGWRTELRLTRSASGGGLRQTARRARELAAELVSPTAADLLLQHRRTFPVRFAGRIRGLARRRVFDMDDAIDLAPPSRQLDERERRRWRARFEATVNQFDLVLCGNRELASRLPHGRYELLPTPIDTTRFAPARLGPPRAKTLGWVGHSDNLQFLESLDGAFRELVRRHPQLRLIVVADRPPRLSGVPVEFRPWKLAAEVSCFDGIGVGLMPLDDTPWARGKCAFKAIQFLSLALPVVVSPVGMNGEVVRDGQTGLLAGSEREWVDALDRLLSDRALGRELGAAGRRLVEERYALNVVSRRLIEILDALARTPRTTDQGAARAG